MIVKQGDTGLAVGRVQQALVECGYAVPSDENAKQIFGVGTLASVRAFQASHLGPGSKPLAEDGVVGDETWWALQHPGGGMGYTAHGWLYNPSDARPEVRPALDAAYLKIGVHEDPDGSNDGPAVRLFTDPGFIGSPWCFTPETEILTEQGWMAFAEYGQQRVAQVDPLTMQISLTPIIGRIRKHYEGRLVTIKRRSLELTMDPEHKLFGRWAFLERKALAKTWPDLEKFSVDELARARASKVSIPAIRGSALSAGVEVSDRDLKLLAAFVADGCIHRERLSFQVSREYKTEWLTALEPGHIYTASRSYGPRSNDPLTTFEFAPPSCFEHVFADYKVFAPQFIWSLAPRQAALLLDTLVEYDGITQKGHHVIQQASKARIDAMHLLAVVAGYPAQTQHPRESGEFGSTMYALTFEREGRPTVIHADQTRVAFGETELHCVQVPSGLIVVRPPYGKAIVVGNCALFASWAFAQLPGGSPFGRIAGVWALYEWAEGKGLLVPASEPVLPGDIGVILRGERNDPNHRGHALPICADLGNGRLASIAGNESNAVRGGLRDRSALSAILRPVPVVA